MHIRRQGIMSIKSLHLMSNTKFKEAKQNVCSYIYFIVHYNIFLTGKNGDCILI